MALLLYAAPLTVYEVPEVAEKVCVELCVIPLGDPWVAASLVNPLCGVTIVPFTIILLIMSTVEAGDADCVKTNPKFTKTSSSYVGVNVNVNPEISVGADAVVEAIVVAVPLALPIVTNAVDVVKRLAVLVMPWTLVVTAAWVDTVEAAVPAGS